MRYQFNSLFADDILAYIKLRCSLGNKEDTFARRVHSFDIFCMEKYSDRAELSQEMAEGWCSLRPNEKENTLQLRTSILRGFSKYLISIGKDAHVLPDGFAGKTVAFIPYLYNDVELSSFFIGADHLSPHPLSPYREYVIPVMFRVLYCCGLRPQEVRHLELSDVNLEDSTFYIEDSKRKKDRIVAISPELIELCRKYNCLIQTFLPGREYFFQNPNGGPYRSACIQQFFYKCWKAVGVSFLQEHKPRVYDWRHNFATRVIISWMNEKKDVMNLLPYLSTYMGHSSLEYTAYYIHLVPEHLKSSNSTDWICSQGVPNYED
jgi:integrase